MVRKGSSVRVRQRASEIPANRVLLDIPRVHGVPWLEPGQHVFADDLEAAERNQRVSVGVGDILPVRTGQFRSLGVL